MHITADRIHDKDVERRRRAADDERLRRLRESGYWEQRSKDKR